MTFLNRSKLVLSLCTLIIIVLLVVAAASEVIADDFRMLLVRDSGFDKVSKLPTGQVTLKAGYLDGIEPGLSGVIWRKNKYKGQIDIADFEVTEVAAYESTCNYTVKHPDFYVLKKDQATMEVVVRQDADILEVAMESLGNGHCFEALLYFDAIYCATRDNAFVQQQIAECRRQVSARLADTTTTGGERKARLLIQDLLEKAARHHKYKNDLAADLLLKRAIALGCSNSEASTLREAIPQQDFATMLSPSRCK